MNQYYLKNKERLKKQALEYYYTNQEERMKYNREWKKQNIIKASLYRKQWRLRHPQRFKEMREKSRRKRDYGGQYDFVMKRGNHICQNCGSQKNLRIHHKDGSGYKIDKEKVNNSPNNLMVVCEKCHRKIHQGK